ncbi:efflux RND transporter permease subunit [Mesoaciditoga sp.]
MQKLGLWISKHRWFIIVIFLLLSVFMAYEASKVQVIDNITKYVPENDPEISFYNRVANRFKMNNLVLIGMKYHSLFSMSSLKNISEITKGIQKIEGVKSVISLTNAPWIEDVNGSVQVSKINEILKSGKHVNLKSLEKSVMSSPIFKGQFVSPDGRSAMIMASLDASLTEKESINVSKKIEDYVNLHSTAQKVYYTGIPTSNLSARKIALKNMEILIPLSLAAVAIVLLLLFRNAVGFLLPLLSVILSSTWTVGLIRILGYTMTLANIAIPVVVIALGNAYGIYVVNKYFEEKDADHSVRVSHTLRDIGTAILLSALTTIASFLSLVTVNINPIRAFGVFTAIGISFALLVNLLFTPAMASFSKKHASQGKKETKKCNLGRKIANVILKHRVAFIALTFLAIGAVSLYIFKIQSDMRLSVLLGKNNDVVRAMDYFNDNFNGSDFLIVDFKGKATDPYLLRSENLISMYSTNHFKDVVGGTYSLATMIQEMNERFNDQNYIPLQNDKIQNLWFLMQGNDLSQLVDGKLDESVEQIRVKPISMHEIRELRERLEKFVNTYIFKSYSYVDLSNCDEREKVLAERALSDYLNGYFIAIDKDISPIAIKKITHEVVNISTEEILKSKSSNVSNDLVEYLKSLDMLDGFSSKEISKLRSAIEQSLKNGYSQGTFESTLKEKIGEENEEMLAPILEAQIPALVNEFRTEYIENLLKEELKDISLSASTFENLSLELSDRNVAIPTKNGKYHVEIGITGIPVVYNHVSDMLMRSQYESMLLSAIVVFILLVIQTSSLTLSLIGLIPVGLTVIFNFSVMGMFHIPLNAITITIASMTIGVGVDYVVQIFSRFKVEFKKIGKVHEAMVETFATSGKGIVFNSLASSMGFATFFISSIGGLKQFAVLSISTMVVALLLSVFVLVPLLSMLPETFYRKAFKITKKKG